MAKNIIAFRKAADQPKPTTQSEAKEIARETLAIVNQCAQALHDYHAETEITLGHICGLLDAMELIAIRAIAKGGGR